MPSLSINTLLVSSLLLLGVIAAPIETHQTDSLIRRPHWSSNTLTIPSGKIHGLDYYLPNSGHAKRSTGGDEIAEWLKMTLRENPDAQLNAENAGPELVKFVEILREEVKREMEMEVQGQQVVG